MKTLIIPNALPQFALQADYKFENNVGFTTSSSVYTNVFKSTTINNNDIAVAKRNQEKSVTYDELGLVVETEMYMDVLALPFSVTDYIQRKHSKNIIKEASEIIEANGNITYKAELKGIDLIFNSQGVFIKLIKK